MSVKLLTNGGCIGLSESTLIKMPHCCKSHVAAQIMKNVPGGKDLNHLLYVPLLFCYFSKQQQMVRVTPVMARRPRVVMGMRRRLRQKITTLIHMHILAFTR